MRGMQLALVVLACAACTTVAQRRVVRVRQRVQQPLEEEQEPQEQHQQQIAQARSAQAGPELSYYHVLPESEEYQQEQRPVAPTRQQQQAAYRPRTDVVRAIQSSPRTKESTRAPPVQTIRNFNTINDDGSFTFGYEAADGSFKEETRGTDCVVRGKYGYIDPDGNKREFTYVSGNPCDPNNPNPEEDDRSIEEDDSEENVPERRPVARPVPVRPNVARVRPAAPAPSNAVFQNEYQGQRLLQQQPAQQVAVTPRPVAVTPRPVVRQQVTIAAPLATTYRPQIQNYPTVTSTAAPVTRRVVPAPIPTQNAGPFNFDAELKKFELNGASPTPASRQQTTYLQPAPFTPTAQPLKSAAPAPISRPAGNPFYNSQLIFDPASGQYNTVLYQQLPKGVGDFSLNTRLQPYVNTPQHQQQHQFQQQQPQQFAQQYQPQAPSPFAPSHLQGLRAGPSEPLRAAPGAHGAPARYPANVVGAPQQSFYYINPSLRNQFSTGQIDSFLKGHNLQI